MRHIFFVRIVSVRKNRHEGVEKGGYLGTEYRRQLM